MKITIVFILLVSVCMFSASHAREHKIEHSDWGKHFMHYSATGTIVVRDSRATPQLTQVFNPKRAKKRYSPASTFKVPHTLFALEAGIIQDEFEVFSWDGVNRAYAPHNQDQDLRSAMRNSALWVYEIFAGELGEEKARKYLIKTPYGNADPRTSSGLIGLTASWQYQRTSR